MTRFERRIITTEISPVVRGQHDHSTRADAGTEMRIAGYAAVFEKSSVLLYNFKEKIQRGAFAESIKNNDVKALWSHNPDLILGRNLAGNLRLTEDATGLHFELDLPDTSWGRDAYELVRRGIVSQMSFGFMVKEEAWKQGENGQPHERTLINVDLLEVSPVAFPAYPDTTVAARELEKIVSEKEAEWNSAPKAPSRIADLKRALGLRELVSKFK